MQKASRQHYYLQTSPRHLTPYTEERWNKYFFAYGLPKETITAIMMLYKNMKEKVCSPDRDTDFFDIAAGMLQETH